MIVPINPPINVIVQRHTEEPWSAKAVGNIHFPVLDKDNNPTNQVGEYVSTLVLDDRGFELYASPSQMTEVGL